jgi:hypothetical protein
MESKKDTRNVNPRGLTPFTSTADMEFSPISSGASNVPAMQRDCYEQWEGPNTHDGNIPIRTFYYRRQTPYNGGENSAVLELRSAGPVQCARDENDKAAPDPNKDLKSSVTISQCRVRAGTVKNQAGSNPFDFFEAAQLFNDFTQEGSPEPVFPLGYVSFDSGTATLSINQDTGKVTYGPGSQVIPVQQAGGYETSFLNTGAIGVVDYRVQAEGVVRPSILVQGVVGVGEEADLKWNFGVGAEVRKNNVVTGLEWTASKSVVPAIMQWIIYKAYREVLADQTLGPVIVVGEAIPENEVEIVPAPTCERL